MLHCHCGGRAISRRCVAAVPPCAACRGLGRARQGSRGQEGGEMMTWCGSSAGMHLQCDVVLVYVRICTRSTKYAVSEIHQGGYSNASISRFPHRASRHHPWWTATTTQPARRFRSSHHPSIHPSIPLGFPFRSCVGVWSATWDLTWDSFPF